MPGRLGKMLSVVTRARDALRKEQEVSHTLHDEAVAAVRREEREDPGLREQLEQAYAYAVFPSVGRASAVLGATYGLGEVFRHDRVVGYAGIVQLTLGVQLGGQTFTEIVLFHDAAAFERFKAGKVGFASNASAVIVRAGAAATNDGKGTEVRLYSKGGLQLEAAIGGQKLVFKPAALTRVKGVSHVDEAEEAEQEQSPLH